MLCTRTHVKRQIRIRMIVMRIPKLFVLTVTNTVSHNPQRQYFTSWSWCIYTLTVCLQGLFYNCYPSWDASKAQGKDASSLEFQTVFYHVLGTSQDQVSRAMTPPAWSSRPFSITSLAHLRTRLAGQGRLQPGVPDCFLSRPWHISGPGKQGKDSSSLEFQIPERFLSRPWRTQGNKT